MSYCFVLHLRFWYGRTALEYDLGVRNENSRSEKGSNENILELRIQR